MKSLESVIVLGSGLNALLVSTIPATTATASGLAGQVPGGSTCIDLVPVRL